MDRRKSNKTEVKNSYIVDLLRAFFSNPVFKNILIIITVISLFSLAGLLRIGPVSISKENYISVTGMANSVENNQAARFSLTIKHSDIAKDKATELNSTDTKRLVELIKNFGIDASDLETISNSLYQEDRQNVITGSKSSQNQLVWVASTTVEAHLKDLTKVDAFVSMISSQPNVEVYGPSYYLDEEKIDEARLLSDAIESAREKAEFVSKNNNSKLGKIISIEEVLGDNVSLYDSVLGMGSGGSSENFQPGTTKISKYVVVTFELK